MKLLLLFVLVSCLSIADANSQKRKTFKIYPGEKLIEKIPKEEIYTYPEFTQGTVYLLNNTYSPATMNYNSLFREMQFVDQYGDTISIADEKMIKYIVIKTDTFYFNEGYLKLVLNNGDVKLAHKKYIEFINREKLTGFGESSGGSVETYNSWFGSNNYLKELVAKELLTMATNNKFYIADRFNHFKLANKKNVMEIFASKENEVEKYMKENKVDFSNEEDLKKLITRFTIVK
jgi:hypothetical protein